MKERAIAFRSRILAAAAAAAFIVAAPALAYTRLQAKADVGGQAFLTSLSSSASSTRVCPGASVTLYNAGTTTKPSTFAASAGTSKANPTTADSNGEWFFYVSSGTYDYLVSGCGVTRTIRDIVVGAGSGSDTIGVVDVASYATRGDGAVDILTGVGTVAMTNGSATVNGVSTAFLTDLAVGDVLKINGVDELLVRSITDDDTLTLHKVYPGATGVYAFTYRKPWSGWAGPIVEASDTAYYFRAGKFAVDQFNMRGFTRFRLYGAGPGATQIIGTGSGAVINIGADAPTTFQVIVEQLQIRSTGLATNGIELESTHHSNFRDLKIRDVTNAGIFLDFGVHDHFENIRVTGLDGDQSTAPAYGLYFTCLDPANITGTVATVDGSTHLGSTTTAGIYVGKMSGAIFTNTVSEGNLGRGVWVTSDASKTTLIGVHTEANTGRDFEFDSTNTTCINCFSDSEMVIDGNRNTIIGGWLNCITLNGSYNRIIDVLDSLSLGGCAPVDTGVGNITDNNAPSSTQVPRISRRNNEWITRTTKGNVTLNNDPGYMEFGVQRIETITATPTNISDTVYETGKPWRIVFMGYFQNNNTGTGLAMTPFMREVTDTAPSFAVGGITLTVTQSVGGVMQIAVTAGGTNAGFVGSFHIVVGRYATGKDANSIVTPGRIQFGGALLDGVAFASLGTPTNGTVLYCSDCTVASPCAGAGTGAIAKRLNGAWVCN